MNGPQAPVRWLSGRAVGLHLALLLVLPMCAAAARWQVERALSGNVLSWLYVFEWPAFAGIAVWLWWVLLTTRAGQPDATPAAAPRDPAGALLAARSSPVRWEAGEETEPLRAYNAYLAGLNAGRKVPRPARSSPWLRRRSRLIRTEAHGS